MLNKYYDCGLTRYDSYGVVDNHHCKNRGEVSGMFTKGKKSSVSLVSSFDPYISFIALSAKVSHNLYRTGFSYPLAGLIIPM